MPKSEQDEPDTQRQAVVRRIREEIARRRMSRQGLADMARISLSTLEKAMAGKRSFTLPTLIRIEDALGIPLRAPAHEPAAAGAAVTAMQAAMNAPDELGGYSRQSVSWLEGRYLTLRPGFNRPQAVYGYVTTIHWNEAEGRLVFAESDRQDAEYAQSGAVALPYLSSHIYLVTNDHGQFRTVTLGRPDHNGVMRGILCSLYAGQGTALSPIACPIMLTRLETGAAPPTGEMLPGSAGHAAAREALDATIAAGFASFRL